jgi:hypothetical protein
MIDVSACRIKSLAPGLADKNPSSCNLRSLAVECYLLDAGEGECYAPLVTSGFNNRQDGLEDATVGHRESLMQAERVLKPYR